MDTARALAGVQRTRVRAEITESLHPPEIHSTISAPLPSQDRPLAKLGAGERGAGPLEIDSLFQVLFIIPSTDTDMCLLKGDTVPLTLTPSTAVIWDASPGSSGVTFQGEGQHCVYL